MFKKTISLMLAVFMILSAAVCADSAETNSEPSKASGTFFFDPTTWGTKYTVCFYIWDKEAKQFASKTGWMDDDPWGSIKKTGVEASNGLYESYEIDLTGRENHHVYLILLNHATGGQTYDYQIDSSIFGKTCRFTGEHLEGPSDDPKTEHITFDAPTNTTTSGTFFFDPTTWGTGSTVCFYIWDKEAKQFASKTGWMDDDPWGSIKKTGVDASNGLYESYEIDLTGREDHHVYLILLKHDTGDQTYDYQIDSSIFGKTCRFTGEHLEGPSDDPKTERITFEAPGNTNKSQIGDVDSSGTIDSADSLFILRASINLETLNDAQKQLADVDENGSVTSADSLEVLRYSVKLPSNTDIGKFL